MLIISYFVDETGEYGLSSTRRMDRVCDLDSCNELYQIRAIVYVAKLFYVQFGEVGGYA